MSCSCCVTILFENQFTHQQQLQYANLCTTCGTFSGAHTLIKSTRQAYVHYDIEIAVLHDICTKVMCINFK